jgi:hypothetical protein
MHPTTFFKHITKRVTNFGINTYRFNDPSGPEAVQVLSSKDGTTMLDVNQSFNRIVLTNTSDTVDCFISFDKTQPTALQHVIMLPKLTTIMFETTLTTLHLYTVGNIVIYFSVFA